MLSYCVPKACAKIALNQWTFLFIASSTPETNLNQTLDPNEVTFDMWIWIIFFCICLLKYNFRRILRCWYEKCSSFLTCCHGCGTRQSCGGHGYDSWVVSDSHWGNYMKLYSGADWNPSACFHVFSIFFRFLFLLLKRLRQEYNWIWVKLHVAETALGPACCCGTAWTMFIEGSIGLGNWVSNIIGCCKCTLATSIHRRFGLPPTSSRSSTSEPRKQSHFRR